MDAGLHHSHQQLQTLSPQMRQSLQFLQAPVMELRQLVQQEMLINPILESETTDDSFEEQDLGEDRDDEFEHLSQLDEEWRLFYSQNASVQRSSPEDEERRRHMMESITAQETLQEHLLHQLDTEDIPPQVRELANVIMGHLDDRGYLRTSTEDIAYSLSLPHVEVETALEALQSLHPPGVGARDLKECLLLQLERENRRQSLAGRIIEEHLDDLAGKRFPLIARKMGVTVDAVARAAEQIAGLEPWPGRAFDQGQNPFVKPEITILREPGGDFVVTMIEDSLPRLRISNHYKSLLADGKQAGELQQYIREKIRGGKFIIQSIHQRQQTLFQIATEILKRQRLFFEHGPAHLKPLTMAQVGEAVGVHETTVSRAVAGKFVETPHGVREMKSFFSTGLASGDGEMSNNSVKQALAEMIRHENPAKPMSDEVLTNELNRKGIQIKRRTVAKYREELHILPSHLRRQYR